MKAHCDDLPSPSDAQLRLRSPSLSLPYISNASNSDGGEIQYWKGYRRARVEEGAVQSSFANAQNSDVQESHRRLGLTCTLRPLCYLAYIWKSILEITIVPNILIYEHSK